MLSGPVRIPKLFNGRDRLFFMSNFEGFKRRRTDLGLYTTPPDSWRHGDFSSFLMPLYDPLSRTVGADGKVTATLFGIFGALRHLDAELAGSLCRKYRQLAAAVVAFPHGYCTEATATPEENPPEESVEQCAQPITLQWATPVCFPSRKP